MLSNSQIPNTLIKSISGITTLNNTVTLTTDNISEGGTHKYQHLPINESDVTNLTTD